MDQNKILRRKRLEASDLDKQIEFLQNYKIELRQSIKELEEKINANNKQTLQ